MSLLFSFRQNISSVILPKRIPPTLSWSCQVMYSHVKSPPPLPEDKTDQLICLNGPFIIILLHIPYIFSCTRCKYLYLFCSCHFKPVLSPSGCHQDGIQEWTKELKATFMEHLDCCVNAHWIQLIIHSLFVMLIQPSYHCVLFRSHFLSIFQVHDLFTQCFVVVQSADWSNHALYNKAWNVYTLPPRKTEPSTTICMFPELIG